LKTVPSDLSADEIRTALHERWSIRPATLQHLPLGFGSHHWGVEAADGQQWFITLDDLTAEHLGDTEETSLQVLATAFSTAITLRDSVQLPFVIAPVVSNTGDVVHRLSKRYSMAVFPFLDIVPTEFGRFRDRVDCDEALQLVGHVHNATHHTPVDDLRRNTLVIPNRAGLQQAMRSTDTPWTAGPFSEPARFLLRSMSVDCSKG
jgi:spectinomycin phosphotransferase